ncbi:MAG TPA: right-handed parallel beta-helix repeat-containing protein, partial [Terriglobales bacterium]|nr:right-handed parallel beta-helix repeat-containing protein [Terriglobales bacterium]
MYPAIAFLFATIFAVLSGAGCYASSSDSVPELARAVSELPADSSVLDLPEGVYTIASTWTISRAGVTIRGAGAGKTVLIRDPKFNGVMLKMDGANSTVNNLTLDGNGTAMVISLNRPGAVADTIDVKNFDHIGIAVPASDCRVSNCLISGFGQASIQSIGIWHDAGRTPTASKIVIDRNTIKNNGMCGIYCTGGEMTIANNQLSGNHIITSPGGGQIDVGNAFSTNTVATITGNTIENGGSIKAGGIELGGGNFTVANNVIRDHGGSGIGIGHNVIRATIKGNTISNCGHNIADKNKPQARAGIYITYGASNVEISGNRCFDDQPNKTQTWGIILSAPPARPDPRFSPRATERVIIKGNDLRGNIHPEG